MGRRQWAKKADIGARGVLWTGIGRPMIEAWATKPTDTARRRGTRGVRMGMWAEADRAGFRGRVSRIRRGGRVVEVGRVGGVGKPDAGAAVQKRARKTM